MTKVDAWLNAVGVREDGVLVHSESLRAPVFKLCRSRKFAVLSALLVLMAAQDATRSGLYGEVIGLDCNAKNGIICRRAEEAIPYGML